MKELSFDVSQFPFNQIKCVCVCVCVCVGAGTRLMSTEQQLFSPSEIVQADPNRPALDGNNSRSLDRIARRAPQTQSAALPIRGRMSPN